MKHDEPTADDHVKPQGGANLTRLPAVESELPEPDLGSDDQPAPFNAALKIVRAASEALEHMRARCRDVEAFAQQVIEYHRAQLATADTVIKELDSKTTAQEESIRQLHAQAVADLEDRQRLQRSLDEMRSALEGSQELLRAAEGRASAGEAWLVRLHTEIASAFKELPAAPRKPPLFGPK